MRRPSFFAAWIAATVAAGAVFAGAVFVGGCGSRETAAPTQRLVTDPGPLLDRYAYLTGDPVREWAVPAPADRFEVEAVGLAARQVDVIDVELAAPGRGSIRLLWAAAGEALSAERRLELDAGSAEAGRLRFKVRHHPRWRGRIDTLRLSGRGASGSEIRLERVAAARLAVDPEALAAALRRSWSFDLSRDVRPGLATPPGAPRELEVNVGEGSVFESAVGLSHAVRKARTFRLSLLDAAGRSHRLASRRLGPGAEPAKTWHDLRVDLSRFAGQRVRLVLASEGGADAKPLEGLPVWADPRVSTPAEVRAPNIVLISIDTLRADHLSLYGYDRPTSPHLDRWARRHATVFANAIAPSPWTLPSHVSMFTGRDAIGHGVNYRSAAPGSLVMLAEVLRQAGYSTRAVTGGGYVHPAFGLAQGFATFRYQTAGSVEEGELERLLDEALAAVEEGGQAPFFLFFHTYDVHEPYRARQPFFSRLTGSPPPPDDFVTYALDPSPDEGLRIRRWLAKGGGEAEPVPLRGAEVRSVADVYDSRVAYVDEQLGRLFDWWERRGRHRDTVLVVTSDHGEALGDKGLAGHGNLYDHLLRIPLVVALPGGAGSGRSVERQVRLIDVAPTLLALAGVGNPAAMDGVSLLPLIHGEAVDFPRQAWSYAASSNVGLSLRYANRLKYIYNHVAWNPGHGREELYRLDEDPSEESDRAGDFEQLAALRRQAAALLDQRARGLEVGLSNRGETPLHGYLSGDGVTPQRVKSWDLSCRCVSWQGGTWQRAGFRLPPGQSFRLFLNNVRRGRLEVGASHEVAPEGELLRPASLALDLGEIPPAAAFELVGGAWNEVAAAGGSETALTILWRGMDETASPDAPAVDRELRQRLSALGYVD